MKKLIIFILYFIVSGCTTSARDTPATINDYSKYISYSCDSLYTESLELARIGTELSRSIDRERTNDMVLIGLFGILSAPAVNPDQTTPENEQLSEVKGNMALLERASSKRNCPIIFKSNESVEYGVDNSSNPVLDLEPIDKSVRYKVIKLY